MENYEINLPYSLEAEQAVLGSILIDPSCLELIQSKGFSPEYFFRTEHKAIFNAMLKIQALSQTIDPLLVLENLKADPSFDEAAGKNYLFELSQVVPSTANVESYAKIIKDKFFTRTLINVSREILNDATSGDIGAEVLLNSAEQKIYDIRQGKTSNDVAKLADVITDTVYDRLEKLNSPDPAVRDQFKGFTTGFSDLDRLTSGLNKADLIIVGARPAMGKTSFALNLARNASVLAGKKVLFFSLEMTKEQLAMRVVSTEARIRGNKMRTGQLDEGDWLRLSTAAEAFANCELYFDDTSNITVNEMKAKVRRLRDVDLVVVDYLQLMKLGTRAESRVQEVSEITRNLKLMAKDLNIPVVVLAQLSRGTEGHGVRNHRPQLADLRESGSIEQDADIVLMLYREDYYADDTEGDIEKAVDTVDIIVAKNRHGATGTVTLGWNSDYTLFSTIEERNFNEPF